jgi:AbrB family looped-hinge helix DNA binding protein
VIIMRYTSKMTTKGQVTVPAEVREALGFGTGDMLAFEVKEDYVAVTRRPTLEEVREKYKDLLSAPPRFATDDEAIADYFDNLPPKDLSPTPIIAVAGSWRRGHR